MPFRFFSLPPELRNMVYIEVLASPTDTETARTEYLHGNTPFLPCTIPTSLLLTNRQIHTEASPLLWTHRFWQSRISYDATLFDFREPLWTLPPPPFLPFLQNLEITLRNPRANEYAPPLHPEHDPRKQQKEISGTMGKLLAILVDEIAAHRPLEHPSLKRIRVHLPCLCPRCDSPNELAEREAHRGPFWEPPDTAWKAGVNAESLSVMLRPLRRLRVSRNLEFRSDCLYATELPAALQAVVAEIAGVVVGGGRRRGWWWGGRRRRGWRRRWWGEGRGGFFGRCGWRRGRGGWRRVWWRGSCSFRFGIWMMGLRSGGRGRGKGAGEWFLKGVEEARRAMGGGEGVDG
ncbi:MAG: hypothetical protein LQ339_001846 [Xanthoria mediterranea]|nr:MAG: hypothetical protein LQ339_001846 [Xanthoria mediterranea]